MAQAINDDDLLFGKDNHMLSEANRLASFKKWPFRKGNCAKQNMARAGFYHCNIKGEKDTVRCFVCFECLEGWDEDDDPFEEHFRTQPQCLFAKLKTEQGLLTIRQWTQIQNERNKNLLKMRYRKRLEKTEELITRFKSIAEKFN